MNLLTLPCLALLSLSPICHAQSAGPGVPATIPFQGRVSVNGQPFTGTGHFKFLLISKNWITSTPQQATAGSIILNNGAITSVALNAAGAGYTIIPTVTISGGGGSGAILQADVINGGGIALSLVSGGSGYTSAPTITISPPQPGEEAVWSNTLNVSPIPLTEPGSARSIVVSNGIYATTLANQLFTTGGTRNLDIFGRNMVVRVWFSHTGSNFQQLTPDFPILAAPFALVSARVVSQSSTASGANANALGSSTASGELSFATGRSTTAKGYASFATGLGATTAGDGSFATGKDITASGNYSFATGQNTTATRDCSLATGKNTTASSSYSFAMGEDTTASGAHSLATGKFTTASGPRSFSGGEGNLASGPNSLAFGLFNTAPSNAETVIGSYATSYSPTSPLNFGASDRLFTIGNGTASTSRRNALTMLKDGHTDLENYPTSVSGDFTRNHALAIRSRTNGGDVLALSVNSTSPGTDSNFITFFKNGGTNNASDAIGEIQAIGGNGIEFVSLGADYAEFMPALDLTEKLQPGDLVAVRSGKITRDTSSFDQLMVISTQPIIVGNRPQGMTEENAGNFHKVAFIGQVPVKVCGSVQSGDFLLASGKSDGTAIAKAASDLRASDRAQIIGRAWDSSEEPGEKLINAAVGLDLGEALVAEIKDLRRAYDQLERRVIALESRPTKEATRTISTRSLSAQ